VHDRARDAGVMWVSGTLTRLFNANAKDVSCRRAPYYDIRTASTRRVENGTFEGWDLDGPNRGVTETPMCGALHRTGTCMIRVVLDGIICIVTKRRALYHGRGPISRRSQSHGRGRHRRHYRRRWDTASAGRRRQDRGPSGALEAPSGRVNALARTRVTGDRA